MNSFSELFQFSAKIVTKTEFKYKGNAHIYIKVKRENILSKMLSYLRKMKFQKSTARVQIPVRVSEKVAGDLMLGSGLKVRGKYLPGNEFLSPQYMIYPFERHVSPLQQKEELYQKLPKNCAIQI